MKRPVSAAEHAYLREMRGAPFAAYRWSRATGSTRSGHPAAGECGLFAAVDLAPGAWVVDYVGAVCLGERQDAQSDYVCDFGEPLGDVRVDVRRNGGALAGCRGRRAPRRVAVARRWRVGRCCGSR